jgi:hypothetical protein
MLKLYYYDKKEMSSIIVKNELTIKRQLMKVIVHIQVMSFNLYVLK